MTCRGAIVVLFSAAIGSSVLAALTGLTIFAYCTVVGLGLVLALTREHKPYLPLIAPTIGAVAVVIATIWLNELGLPIASFGPALLAVFLAASIYAIFRCRLRVPWKQYAWFLPVLCAGFGLAGRPMFEFGFNWLSYANDDMANYALQAHRVLELGFYTVPPYSAYNFNKDATLVYWLNWTVNNERFGAEMILALCLSVFPLNGFQLFMPMMVALGLVQICATAALVYHDERYLRASLLTAGLMAVAALPAFGIEYQLLAQVIGLPALIVSSLLLFDMPRQPDVRSLVLCSIATTGLAAIYPEISPFLFLGAAVYFGLRFVRRSLDLRVLAVWLSSVFVLTTLLLNVYLRNYLAVVIGRLAASSGPEVTTFFIVTFPFYLIPSGIANMFGIYSAVEGFPEPWLSLGVLLGFVLLAATVVAVFEAVREGEAAGAPVAVMLALGALLFVKQAGCGLFKLAMYVQPFIIPCLVLWWLRLWKVLPRPVTSR